MSSGARAIGECEPWAPPLDEARAASIASPALVIDAARLERNLQAMVRIARSPNRLRVHLKTHKMPAIVRLCEGHGISKHKCATIAEAEMAARAGAQDVLISYPTVGPNLARLARLIEAFPSTQFRATVDDLDATTALSGAIAHVGRRLPVLIDLDVGMGRTGVAPGEIALRIARRITQLGSLEFDGLHLYDGHARDPEIGARARTARTTQAAGAAIRQALEERGISVNRMVVGGTPAFPMHAASDEPGLECSPGTCVLHDGNYRDLYPDLPFECAAALLSRVLSRPRAGRICLDVGHKAVAGDSPLESRVRLIGVPDARVVGQSEEHLVVDTPAASDFPPGTPVWVIPGHVCPTVALHASALVARDGRVVDSWLIEARDRVISI